MFRKAKHEHSFDRLVDVQNAKTGEGYDATDVLLKCRCGELFVQALNGHFDVDKIRAAYEGDIDPSEITEAANATKTWIKDNMK